MKIIQHRPSRSGESAKLAQKGGYNIMAKRQEIPSDQNLTGDIPDRPFDSEGISNDSDNYGLGTIYREFDSKDNLKQVLSYVKTSSTKWEDESLFTD